MKDEAGDANDYAIVPGAPDGIGTAGLEARPRPEERLAVETWRRKMRAQLIEARLALPLAERVATAREIARELDRLVDTGPGAVIGAFWPRLGEPDLRDWLGGVVARGGRAALPVVAGPELPLQYRAWTPSSGMRLSPMRIPEPAAGELVTPTIIIAPFVGYDLDCHRLGYGGGHLDRTLAALDPRPLAIGVGYAFSGFSTIHPQPHDVPMDVIVAGEGAVIWRETN